jgi:hypothetical protein
MQADQNIIYKELGDEAALLNTHSGELYTLNETGKYIWNALVAKEFNLTQISQNLCEIYDISETEANSVVSSFLIELRSQKLLK